MQPAFRSPIEPYFLDVSIEQVAALSSQNTLPEPTLDLSRYQHTTSAFSSTPTYRRETASTVLAPTPAYASDDPWNVNSRFGPPGGSSGFDSTRGGLTNGAPSNLAGSGLPNEWWKKQEVIRVNLLGPQGFILNRYMVYEVVTEVRFSDISL